ncbi:hypothetical protein MES4922_10083 [Mesorhizobium ventifaucium]|uniref:Uncharacterized protein n=1 Tax=Mesorhizobium ventifaucium TaxID=666020 RepID=A0ABM9DCD1_9HYPH|nr:hypothetical protein MES4922_10083 [Mesorhizobium ventifaucium]
MASANEPPPGPAGYAFADPNSRSSSSMATSSRLGQSAMRPCSSACCLRRCGPEAAIAPAQLTSGVAPPNSCTMPCDPVRIAPDGVSNAFFDSAQPSYRKLLCPCTFGHRLSSALCVPRPIVDDSEDVERSETKSSDHYCLRLGGTSIGTAAGGQLLAIEPKSSCGISSPIPTHLRRRRRKPRFV